MQEQRDRARSASNFDSMIPESLNIQGRTEFVGYDSNAISSNVIEIIPSESSSIKDEINEDEEGIVLLKETPFMPNQEAK